MTFSTEDHWRFYAEFATYERWAGGPDPHIALVGELGKDLRILERVWRGGCYAAVYNAAFAEMIWRDWPLESVFLPKKPPRLDKWLVSNFPKIITRRERRTVRRPEYMLEFLTGYRQLVLKWPTLMRQCTGTPEENFEIVWAAALEVPRLGRYIAIKLLEYFRRYCDAPIRHPDIRAKGGYFPREMLSHLWPEHAVVAEHDDSPAILELAERLARDTQSRMRDVGVDLNMFEVQVLLCDYKQSWKGRRQYPGRSIDSEMVYALKAEELWGVKSRIWPTRLELFPKETLGEVGGWPGVREELGYVLAKHRYTWSDRFYDYPATVNLAFPLKRVTTKPRGGVTEILAGRLYQSGNWVDKPLKQCAELASTYGIVGIITLWRPDEKLRELGRYEHLSLADGMKVPGRELDKLVARWLATVKSGPVLVQCHAGRNRSGLINALFVRRLLGCSGRDALAYVRQVRPRAVDNAGFESYLLSLPPPGSLY